MSLVDANHTTAIHRHAQTIYNYLFDVRFHPVGLAAGYGYSGHERTLSAMINLAPNNCRTRLPQRRRATIIVQLHRYRNGKFQPQDESRRASISLPISVPLVPPTSNSEKQLTIWSDSSFTRNILSHACLWMPAASWVDRAAQLEASYPSCSILLHSVSLAFPELHLNRG